MIWADISPNRRRPQTVREWCAFAVFLVAIVPAMIGCTITFGILKATRRIF